MDGAAMRQEQVFLWEEAQGEHVFRGESGEMRVCWRTEEESGGYGVRLSWRVESGSFAQTAVGLVVENGAWSAENFVFMAGAVYAGNRFAVRRQPYSPRIPEADTGPLAASVIADIPRLEAGEGPSRIQLLTGDLSAPAMGWFEEGRGEGLYMATERVDPADLWEVTESEDRATARWAVLRGGVREGRYRFPDLRTDLPPLEGAPDRAAGDTVEQEFRLVPLPGSSLQALFACHFDWMMNSEKLPRGRFRSASPSVGEAARVVERKYARENWNEEQELHATTCDPASPHYFQTGWCGGGIADSALLAGQEPESRDHAERGLNRLCREGALASGFFYGKRGRDGRWQHDFEHDAARPYTHRWSLVRRQGDLLFYLLRAVERAGPSVAPESVDLWKVAARRLADALCLLWEQAGQWGQFIDAEEGRILVGGSCSAGIVPAGLVLAYRHFADNRYLSTALAGGEYLYERFSCRGFSSGGPADACQAPDSESCAGLLESLVLLAEETGEDCWLRAAREQAAQLASWVMPYDFPFPPESEFGRHGIPTTGSVFANAQNKHSAPGICTHSGSALRRLSRLTGDGRYERLLGWIAGYLPWAMSSADRPIVAQDGRALPEGWINERVNTSDWDDNVGGVFYGSCWCEVSLLLTAVEVGDRME